MAELSDERLREIVAAEHEAVYGNCEFVEKLRRGDTISTRATLNAMRRALAEQAALSPTPTAWRDKPLTVGILVDALFDAADANGPAQLRNLAVRLQRRAEKP